MTTEFFLIRPVPGMIIQIYIRYCRFDFLHVRWTPEFGPVGKL